MKLSLMNWVSKILLLSFPHSQLLRPLLITLNTHTGFSCLFTSTFHSKSSEPDGKLLSQYQVFVFVMQTWNSEKKKDFYWLVASQKLLRLEAGPSVHQAGGQRTYSSLFSFVSRCRLSNAASPWWKQLIPAAAADSSLQHLQNQSFTPLRDANLRSEALPSQRLGFSSLRPSSKCPSANKSNLSAFWSRSLHETFVFFLFFSGEKIKNCSNYVSLSWLWFLATLWMSDITCPVLNTPAQLL